MVWRRENWNFLRRRMGQELMDRPQSAPMAFAGKHRFAFLAVMLVTSFRGVVGLSRIVAVG